MFKNGSIWRKWDLQVQTILDDRYISIDQYLAAIEEKQPEKYQQLIVEIGTKELIIKYDSKEYFHSDSTASVRTRAQHYAKLFCSFVEIFNEDVGGIAITDHNYEHPYLLDELVNASKNKSFTVIPGVEINVQGVHFLVLFAKRPYDKTTYSEGIKMFLARINITSPKSNGTLTVCNKSYTDIVREAEDQQAIIVYPHCNSSNGLFQERGKTDRTHLADCYNHQKFNILQANTYNSLVSTSEYIDANRNRFKSKYVFTLGTDARSLKDILQPDPEGYYLWIKADPTFNGLRQIIYEPEERVKVNEIKPDFKEDYRVIEKVVFDCRNYMTDEILLNSNLNSIIGSRSSGKSTLLSHIAHTIDSQQVANRGYSPPKGKSWCNFKVFWKDGLGGNSSEQPPDRGILYIPQNYINKLSEAEDSNSPILSFIEKTLFANDESSSIEQKKKQLDYEVQTLNLQITTLITSLFQLRRSISLQQEKIKSLGDELGIKKEIEKLEIEIKKLQVDFTDEDFDKYREILQKGIENKKKIDDIDNDIDLMNGISESTAPLSIKYSNLAFNFEGLNNEFDTKLLNLETEINHHFKDFIATKKKDLLEKKNQFEEENKQLKTGENLKILQKGLQNKVIDEKNKLLQEQKRKLLMIDHEKKLLEGITNKQAATFDEIVSSYKSRLGLKKQFSDSITKSIKDIDFAASVEIDHIKLLKFYEDSINLHNSLAAKDELAEDTFYKEREFIVQSMLDEEHLPLFLELLLSDKLKIKAGRSIESVVKEYFQDFHFIKYSIIYEGDSYEQMTPGKKALVVLKLIIESSQEKYPILIDQPEDDLDSRSIYDAVVPFIKEKKKERQIIIVSHNANVVVGADSEEVIVANRHDSKTPNTDNTPFEYISGSLENSFRNNTEPRTLYKQGVQQHVCDILEGGREAFRKRKEKYSI